MEKGLLNRSDRCPCCWDAATGSACGSADCMPFSFSSGGVATALDGTYSTCRSNATSLPSWAQPTYTAKGRGGTPYVYATEDQTANGCTFYFLQYCRANAAGTNGRAWQVEYFCSGDDGATVAHLETEVLDWSCTCAGARYEFSFAGAVAADYGCCLGGGTVDTTCGNGIPTTLYATAGGCINKTVTLLHFTFGPTDYWQGTLQDGAKCWYVSLFCDSGHWYLDWGCRTETCGSFDDLIGVIGPRVELTGTTSPVLLTGTYTDATTGVPGEFCCTPASFADVPVTVAA